VWAAVLALVLTMRLLTPAGFMPAFDGGRLAVVACPEGATTPMPPMADMDHDHGTTGKVCQSCPHAAVSGGGLIDGAPLALAGSSFLAIPPLLGRAFLLPARSGDRDRPPAIGPPHPA
jgi:hypothetical protein